ncbi:MAG: arylesterase [Alteromonadaceae bacterium]|nr:MAG: arylesterase [Alteromonadaceae bacterium]
MLWCVLLVLPVFASAQVAPVSGKKLLILGDSLSAAYKMPIDQGWVHLLSNRLEQQGSNAQVINGSISGATTAAGLRLLPKLMEKHQPDVIIIELGANDGLQGKPVKYISENLAKLVQIARGDGAKVILFGIRLPPNFGARYTKPFFEQFAKVAEVQGVVLLPFFLSGIAGNIDLMMNDGLHPNAKGQPLVLDNIWPMLMPLLE